MTDFIHEQPKEPKPQKPEPELSPSKRQKRVYLYIAILFTAAFVLILWSFLASQRSNQLVLSAIHSNSTMLQSTLEENQALETEGDTLRRQLDTLNEENEALQSQLKEAEQSLQALEEEHERSRNALHALDWLRRIESSYAAGDAEQTKAMILAFEQTELSSFLWELPLHTFEGSDAEAPAAAYDRILAALFPEGLKQ